ncbi:MAG: hypothetical protein H6828_03945 [Planctomycetes bacterium]|nr:hypothetical protein [Planctomycetota bacterium]
MKRLLAALAGLLLCACASAPKESWVPIDVPLTSTARLWEVTRLALEREGFPITRQGFDPRTKLAISGWRSDLHPFRGNGFRERAEVRWAAGKQPGALTLSVRIAHQNNMNLAKPLDAGYAEWEDAPDNEERARIMTQYLRSLLGSELEMGKRAPRKQPGEKEYGSWEERER